MNLVVHRILAARMAALRRRRCRGVALRLERFFTGVGWGWMTVGLVVQDDSVIIMVAARGQGCPRSFGVVERFFTGIE